MTEASPPSSTAELLAGALPVLRSVTMDIPLGFAILDDQHRFHLVNRRFAEMTGVPQEAHLGRTAAELLPGFPVEVPIQRNREVLATGEARAGVEVTGETPAAPGQARTFRAHLAPIKADGRTLGIAVLVEDVTALKRAEAERERMERFQETFMGMVGHDLAGPVTSILVSGGALLREDLRPPVKSTLRRIVRSARRMERMVGQLIHFTRLRIGCAIPLQPGATDLRALAEQVVAEISAAHPDRAVALRGEGDLVGIWDGCALAEVLANLVGNAVEHGAPQGTVEVVILGRGPDGVTIEVKNGGTIPPEVLPAIFEPFRSGGARGRRRSLGLGLYISRQMVGAHGGTVAVRSPDERGGTTFVVDLPRAAPAAPAVRDRPAELPGPELS